VSLAALLLVRVTQKLEQMFCGPPNAMSKGLRSSLKATKIYCTMHMQAEIVTSKAELGVGNFSSVIYNLALH
jgi:hypothetical protein